MSDGQLISGYTSNGDVVRRKRAEEKARNMAPHYLSAQTPEEIQRVLHELLVHQIELEMQNEELRTTQVQIEDIRARYFDLYDQAPVGYCTISEKGMVLEANLTLASMLGTNSQILLKEPISTYIQRDDQDIFYRFQKELFNTGETLPCELRMVTGDGNTFWASLQAVALQDEDGKKSFRMTISNCNEQKSVQQKLWETNEELVMAKRKSEDANKAKSQFLSNMSHEIRTPMNGLMGMLQMLARTSLTNDQSELLRIAKSSSNSLLAVINDILDYSKIDEGMMVLEEIPFQLGRIVKDTQDLFLPAALDKRLGIKVFVDPSLPDLWFGDPFRIRQVLSNLIGNAVKYTQEGAILIRVTGTEPDDKGNSTLTFSVRDTGIGIDAENLDMLFNRFTQVDSSVTRVYGGTGLGLAICKGLVEMMGGRIWAESQRGKGSTFRFTCRLRSRTAEDDCIENGVNSKENGVSDGDEKILLVVDDDEINHIVIEEFARIKSWKVMVAENGRDAVSLCENIPFHAILMDIQMPEMDGYRATETIRAMEASKGKRTPIIAITAYAMDEDRKKCLAAGMDDFLKKPILAEEFHKMVGKWLKNG